MWNSKCKKNVAGLGRTTSSPSFPIRADGTFAFTERYTEAFGDFTAHITSAHRPLRPLDRVGNVAGEGRRPGPGGKRADSCDSGPQRWAVRLALKHMVSDTFPVSAAELLLVSDTIRPR